MLMDKDNYPQTKCREEYLLDFKEIKGNSWWKIAKFPFLLCVLTLIQIYSPPDAVSKYALAAFLFYAWFDISLQMTLVEKKIDILFLIESSRDVKNVNGIQH